MSNTARTIGAVVLVAVAGVMLLRNCGNSQDKAAIKANSVTEALAWGAGTLVKELEGDGPVVFIQVPALDDRGRSLNQRIRKAFEDGMGKGDVHEIDPLEGMEGDEAIQYSTRVYNNRWAQEFVQWMGSVPDARACVNLNPLPPGLSAEKVKSLPPVISLFEYMELERAKQVASTLGLAAAIVPKPPRRPSGQPSNASADDLFNRSYDVVRP